MPQNKRVLVAMSGGVDSSVTAYLLREAGYECEGATMRLTCSREFGEAGPRSCCSLQDIADAQAVCERLGIPHRVLDMREVFERAVVDKFVDTYEDGRTPNPCIDCNRYLKFGALLDYALAHGFDHIATGHYARIGELAGTDGAPTPLLARIAELAGGAPFRTLSLGVDASKDQSYVLYALTQERLAHVLLPLGGLVKGRDVRRIAEEQGFSNAGKPDSQGICFVPDGNFASYIERRRGRVLPEGDILDVGGQVIGRHQGALRYTVGQRKGLGVAMLHPVYVTRVDARANTVTLGEQEDLMSGALVANDWVWSAPASAMERLLDEAGDRGLAVEAKIRYHQGGQGARLTWADADPGATGAGRGRMLKVSFDPPQRAIAPGQAVVVYSGGVVLGGGTCVRAL